jgi:Tfp pilus assembly protein PilF
MSKTPPDPEWLAGLDGAEREAIEQSPEGRRLLAAAWFKEAYRHQMRGDLKNAEACYQRSIEMTPTAEAYTFLGWTYSFMGQVDLAIGNPYNDIGAYLIEQDDYESAIPWLEQAITAPRYEARHYPHFNLGRCHEALGDWTAAMESYRAALELAPAYKLAHRRLLQLQARLN